MNCLQIISSIKNRLSLIKDILLLYIGSSKRSEGIKVVVLGGPRSGTSMLANMVSLMGYNLGPDKWLKKPDINNRFGYFECLPLARISEKILRKSGGNFHNMPKLKDGWINDFDKEKQFIKKVVKFGNIEVYKDNYLMLLADLYNVLFPRSKWIYIKRSINETYKSRFGRSLSFSEWEELSNERAEKWHKAIASRNALELDYSDFKYDLVSTINKIAKYLEINLSSEQVKACKKIFKPTDNYVKKIIK